MDSTPPLSAASRVTSTVELLELILANLTTTNLARFLRICKTWHNVIISSSVLHERRFLAASAPREWLAMSQTRHDDAELNIVSSDFATAFQLSRPPVFPYPWRDPNGDIPRLYALGNIHPSLDHFLTLKYPGIPTWNATTAQLQSLASVSSLQRVFITNPPSKRLVIKRPRSTWSMTYNRAAGFTIGVVVHLAQKAVVQNGEVVVHVIGTVEEQWSEVKAARKRLRKGKKG
ncbi:hypothetical protein CB0940_06447 [Cercospora beticola]|uniref:F-box domain-containing protein n=1 Tax=Cercospora beticola TaxID=122368 RepID=A0A2G5HYY9_CERBT|nr:hypothetical protein CB0940_06447 [Cercospora beticola]PIA97748.1 hypothetical protein CB0940_06447 [Cercospora beticola]WPA99084.1 hypothetical protein RHO25_003699 [Cercospora beticola]